MIIFLKITILETALIGTRNTYIDNVSIKSADTEDTYFVAVYTEAISTKYNWIENFCITDAYTNACFKSTGIRNSFIRAICARNASVQDSFIKAACDKNTYTKSASTVKYSEMYL